MSATELVCSHGMPSPASCLDCMSDGPVAPPTINSPKHNEPFLARYAGRCLDCDDPIRVGQSIVNTGDGYAHWRCEI